MSGEPFRPGKTIRRGWAPRLAVPLAALFVGCVSGDDVPRIPDEPFPEPPDFEAPPVPDAMVEPDGGEGDGGLLPFRARCENNSECADGWCVTNNDVDICTRRCLQGGCPAGWNCLVVSNTVPDAVSVCVPPDGRLCRQCDVSDDCPEGACHSLDDTPVCGIACDPEAEAEDDPCPPGYTCGEIETVEGEINTQCVPLSGSCTCNENTDNPGAVRFCEVSNEAGTCRGRQTCDPALGWSVCPAETPAVEICDGVDNDCNGLTDDVAGLGEACERRAEVDGVERACVGVNVCDPETTRAECNAPEPVAEVCNSRDDDCDGATDEDFDLDEVCRAGVGACTRSGIAACTPDGSGVACSVEPGEPSDEVCDGVDNDCDGEADEDFVELSQPCAVGVGACRWAGIIVCAEDGAGSACSAEPTEPGEETCNGVDDDCDGTTDEDFPGLRTPCTVGVGLCAGQGITVCAEDGAGITCDAQAGQPAEEVCDSQDNDCDGVTDEVFADLGQVCSVGEGACQRQGVQVCADDGVGTKCSADPGPRAPETCNRVDDDCDGTADEDFPDLARPCAVGDGICRRTGVQVCGADALSVVCDAAPGEPGDEVCNGVDDDCNGAVDEGWPEIGRACELGEGLCRRTGVFVCDPEDPQSSTCDADVVVGNDDDVCDYQDDDCDGRTDEGFTDMVGRYVTLAHCGACGTDCTGLWDPNPAAFGVLPRCEAVGNGAQCGFDCEPGRRDADGVPNNGCELIIDEDAIYVSTPANGGVDAADCGSIDAPCATIGAGLDRAQATGAERVRVAEGIYRESVDLRPGIDLLGGHQRITWRRDPELNISIIEGRTPPGERHRWVVRARDIAEETLLDGFTLNGESPLVEGNAYGVYIVDSGDALTVRGNRIFGGDGGRGRDGAGGDSGDPGLPGGNGAASTRAEAPSPCQEGIAGDPAEGAAGQLGGAGGARTCNGVDVGGGRGGYTSCPTRNRQEGTGMAGLGPTPGEGGSGGWGFLSLADNRCDPSDELLGPADPDSGDDGRAGGDGGAGDGGADVSMIEGHWTGENGTSGADGSAGSGGGGGGGAAGTLVLWTPEESADFGATGGGGGSGGCPGLAGQGGSAGGAAAGIFVTWTGGAQPASFPVLTDNRIARGIGGAGGDGGNGGGGGEGGAGGRGGARGDVWMVFCSFAGGDGGQGGRGGHGGGGGGGMGGVSYDIFVATEADIPAYGAVNIFELAADVPTFGGGGRGGNSSNTEIGEGTDGADGRSGNVGQLQ